MPSIESNPKLFPVKGLKDLFVYEPETGIIRSAKSDRYRLEGQALGTIDNGYVVILYRGHYVFAHRLAFALVNGEWPEDEVDHVNRNKQDNRWVNLRLASRLDNVVNRGIRQDNKTGIAGVSIRRSGRFRVRIDGVRLGDFEDFFEACCVRKSAELPSSIRQTLKQSEIGCD